MSESNDTSDKTLSVPSGKKTLSIKRSVEQGTVRQSFSHGRTKAVVVEKKRRRISKPGETPDIPVAEAPKVTLAPRPQAKAPEPVAAPQRVDAPKPGMVLKTLTSGEQNARRQALADSRIREQEERERSVERARIEAENAASLALEEQESEQRRQAEDARRKKEEDAKRKAEREAQDRLGEPEPSKAKPTGAGPRGGRTLSLEEASREAQRLKRAKPNESRPPRGGDERRRGKLTVTTAFEEDSDRGRSLAAVRRKREREKRALQEQGPREKRVREVIIPETITIQELANRMAERGVEIIKYLMKQGQMLKITDAIDADTAQLIAEEMGHTVRRVSESDVEGDLFEVIADENATEPRPPVVTIMGHVDHGKTSLLDALREANVVSGEAGGITQHIGAYQVTHDDNLITFIDTPGHAAFTAMRARGARVTDIVILVVAADDGVMPQTIEAINHSKAADVPMIVAINKMDKENADPSRVRTELLQHEIVVEAMSGDVQDIEVSAIKKQGLDNLLEAINLQAEILELKADPKRPAQGVVIEAKLDKGRGPVGTVLVQTGTLQRGDIVVAGSAWAKVRALISDTGEQLDQADPSTPVEVLGFSSAPEAGDAFAVVESEAKAREITEYRTRAARQEAAARGMGARGSLEQMMSRLQEGERSEFPLIIKSDVQGSGEAIIGALDNLGTDEVGARVILNGVGGITESDVTLATASGAAIIGFNVRANKQARDLAEAESIEIRYYNIIYNLIDDVKAAMSGMLSPERRETFLGNAEILEIFNVSKVGKIAGCRVTEGNVERGAAVRLIRDNVVIHEGELSQLKRFKDDATTVNSGQECGMAFANYQDMRAGDVIECFRVEEIARTL